jgi:hypothetical protein
VDLESVQPAPTELERWMKGNGSAWVFHGPHQLKMLLRYTALGPHVTVVPISRPGKNSLDFHLVFYLGYLTARNPDGQFAVLSKDKGYDPAIAHARTLKFDLRRIESLGTEGTEAEQPAKTPTKMAAKKISAPKPNVAPKAAAEKKAALTKKTLLAAKKVVVKKAAALIETPPTEQAAKAAPVTASQSNARAVGAIYRDILQALRTQVSNRPTSLRALARHVQAQIGACPAPDQVHTILDRLLTVEAVRKEGGKLVYFPNDAGNVSARASVSPATRPATPRPGRTP